MELYEARISGELITEGGEISWKCYVPRESDVILLEMEEKGRERADFRFSPHRSESPRKNIFRIQNMRKTRFPI